MGREVISASFGVTVYLPLSAGEIAGDREIITGTVPVPFTNTVSASGGTCTRSYQWQSNAAGDWNNIADATGATYAPSSLTQTTLFRRALLCDGVVSAYSNEIKVTVHPVLTVTENNMRQILSASSQPPALAVTVGGGNGAYSYTWQQRNAQSPWVTATGNATGRVYSPPALDETTIYRCVVQSFGMEQITADIPIAIFVPLLAGYIGGDGQKIIAGTQPQTLTNITPPSGGNNVYTYVWEESTDEKNWSATPGNTIDYRPDALHTPASFRRKVISKVVDAASGLDTALTATSNEIAVTVYPLLAVTESNPPQILVAGSQPAALTVTAAGGD